MQPTAFQLSEIQALFDDGRFLRAYRLAEAIGPLETWTECGASVLAGRLSSAVGNRRLGNALFYLAFRRSPRDAQAFVYAGGTWLERFGALIAWEFLDKHEGALDIRTPREECEVRALRGLVAGYLRDFVTAEEHLRAAETSLPDDPWVCVVRAMIRAEQGDHEEALRVTEQGLELRPWYSPAVRMAADQLVYLGRRQQAEALLGQAVQRLESPYVAHALALLYREAGRYDEALAMLQTVESLAPRPDRETRQWLCSCRGDLLYQLERYRESASSLAGLEFRPRDKEAREFFAGFSARILEPGFQRRRKLLDVPFIHQQYDTCAPTTMAMICGYWGKPVDHRAVADEVCYNGTPTFRQRQWASDHGWLAREFTLTEEIAVALVDRGLPFAITTVDPGAGHMMAVVGYDTGRRAILIRDPRQPFIAEYPIEEVLDHYAAFGPGCLLILPPEEAARLEGVALPNTALCDLVFRVSAALDRHDRAEAVRAMEQLEAASPGHDLVSHAGMALANYDCDPLAHLRRLEELLAAHPDCLAIKLMRIQCLRDIDRPQARREHLEALSAAEKSHPIAWSQLAAELSCDARHRRRCRSLLHRALRAWPSQPQSLLTLGGVYWDEGRYAEACQIYRFTLCADEKDEQAVHAYFIASRHLKKTDETMRYLRERFARFGRKSARPSMSFFAASAMLGKAEDGLAVLEESITLRPDDGDLLLYTAARMSEYGRTERAEELLAAAKPHSSPVRYLRTAAHLAMCRLDLPRAAELWRQVLERDPFDGEALANAARLVGQTETPQAAARLLEDLAAKFPYNRVVRELLYEWTPEEQQDRRLEILDALLEHDPANVWALHRKVLLLLDRQRVDEAIVAARAAALLAPESPEQHWVMGAVLDASGKLAEARAEFVESLRARVDFEPAIDGLMRCSPTHAEQCRSLEIVEQEMIRQTIYGEGLLSYWAHARSVLDPEPLLASLEAALAARPDLWHAHAAVIRQNLQLQRTDKAKEVVAEAVRRFPLVPVLWLEAARVYRTQSDQEAEVAAIESALEVAPGWWEAIAMLLEVRDRNNDVEAAERITRDAVRCNPLRSEPHAALAEVHLRCQRSEEALDELKHALAIDPHNNHAWNCLVRWAGQFQQPNVPVELARRLVQQRPGEPAVHYRLASLLSGPETLAERLQCLYRAIELAPRFADAYQQRAEWLAENARFDEARRSLATAAWGERVPSQIRLCEATVWLMQGYADQAIEVVEEILKTERRSVAAWLKLAQCHESRRDVPKYTDAYRQAYLADPTSPVLAAMYANACMANGQRAEARQLLERAVYLAPSYFYAWMSLLDALLAEADFPALERLLVSVRAHFPAEYALSAETQLAAAQGDKRRAFDAFGRLLALPNPDEAVFPPLIGALNRRFPWFKDIERCLREAIDRQGGYPKAAVLWMQACAGRKSYRACVKLLKRLANDPERQRDALVAYCQVYVGRSESKSKESKRIVRRFREVFRSSTEAWAWAGRILNFDHLAGDVIVWMRDWRQRQPPSAWMLYPLAASLFERHCFNDAAEVSAAALRLPPDEWVPMHQTIIAWREARESPEAAARALERLEGLVTGAMWPIYRLLHQLTQCVAQVHASEPQRRPAMAKNAWRRIDGIWHGWAYPRDPLARHIRAQARRALGRYMSIWYRWRFEMPDRLLLVLVAIGFFVLIAVVGGMYGIFSQRAWRSPPPFVRSPTPYVQPEQSPPPYLQPEAPSRLYFPPESPGRPKPAPGT